MFADLAEEVKNAAVTAPVAIITSGEPFPKVPRSSYL